MTKEELKLEALKYLENFQDCAKCKHRWGDCADELDEDCLINNCYSATPKEQDIYLAGAEPREKRIAELEKENAELKTKVTALENANRAMVKELDDTTNGGLNILQNVVKNKEELTKAKEILKSLYFIIESRIDYKNNIEIADEMWRAEQFWKVEK